MRAAAHPSFPTCSLCYYLTPPHHVTRVTPCLLPLMCTGEGAFLDLYQQLSEAPDPAPALAAALEAEAQLAQLTAQVRHSSNLLNCQHALTDSGVSVQSSPCSCAMHTTHNGQAGAERVQRDTAPSQHRYQRYTLAAGQSCKKAPVSPAMRDSYIRPTQLTTPAL